MRVVNHPARQRGKRVGGPDGADEEQRQQREENAVQNFTFGAVAESGAAVNSAIGLLPE
jgi:hypothetical protein